MIKKINVSLFNWTLAGLIIIVGIFMFSNISMINFIETTGNGLKANANKEIGGQNGMRTARILLVYIDRELKDVLLSGGNRDRGMMKIRKYKNDYFEQISLSASAFNNRGGRALLKRVNAANNDYFASLERTMRMIGVDKSSAFENALGETRRTCMVLDELLGKMDDIKQSGDISNTARIIERSEISVVVALLVVLLVVNYIVYCINKNEKNI
jgi:hypothetical protein